MGADRTLADRVEFRQRKDVTGFDVSVQDRADPGVEIRENKAVQ